MDLHSLPALFRRSTGHSGRKISPPLGVPAGTCGSLNPTGDGPQSESASLSPEATGNFPVSCLRAGQARHFRRKIAKRDIRVSAPGFPPYPLASQGTRKAPRWHLGGRGGPATGSLPDAGPSGLTPSASPLALRLLLLPRLATCWPPPPVPAATFGRLPGLLHPMRLVCSLSASLLVRPSIYKSLPSPSRHASISRNGLRQSESGLSPTVFRGLSGPPAMPYRIA